MVTVVVDMVTNLLYTVASLLINLDQVHAKAIGNLKENGQYKIYLKDAWVVITLALFLFIIPAENPFRGILKFKPPPGLFFQKFKVVTTLIRLLLKSDNRQ